MSWQHILQLVLMLAALVVFIFCTKVQQHNRRRRGILAPPDESCLRGSREHKISQIPTR